MNPFGTISQLLGRRILRQFLLVLAVIELIFLAESLQGMLERVLRYGGSALDILTVLFFTSPEILDFALPLALLVGTYLALTAAREDSEFIVCSAAGISWLRIPGFVVAVGALGFLVSLLVVGYVNPLAATAKRIVLFDLQARQAREQISDSTPRDAIETYAGRTFIVTSRERDGQKDASVFIRHPSDDNGWRVTQAKDWSVNGPDARNVLLVVFDSVLDYAFRTTDAAGQPQAVPEAEQVSPLGISAIQADRVSLPVQLDTIIAEADRVRQISELSLTEVLGAIGGGAVEGIRRGRVDNAQQRGGELFGRAILCPVACVFALAAAALTRRGSARYVALPLAAIAVLGFDAVSRVALGLAAQAGLGSLLSWGLLVLLACATPIAAIVIRNGERIIRPAEGRA